MADKEPNREAADRLFKAVTSQNVNLGDFDTFYSKLSEPDGTSRLIAALDKNNIYIGGVDEVNGKLFGGTNPAEKKKGTASPVGDTSSDLLSIKFGGDQYQVNPKTQEVFMGGKRVTVPQNIKDYIAKNMLGVEPVKETGPTDSAGVPMGKSMQSPIQPTGADVPSTIGDKAAKITEKKMRVGAGGVDEIKVEFTPQQQAKIEAFGLNPDQFRNSPLNEDFEKLAKQFDPNINVSDEKAVDKFLDDYKVFSNINAADNLAKQVGVSRKAMSEYMDDVTAEVFIDKPDQKAIYEIDKRFNEAVSKGATPQELDKLKKDRQTAVDFVVNNTNLDVISLRKEIDKKKLDGQDYSAEQKELNSKLSLYNSFVKPAGKVLEQVLKGEPSYNLLDEKFKGKSEKERLRLVYDGMRTELYTIGKKLGFSLEDIKSGKVDIPTYFGFGEDGKRYVELYGKVRDLAPVVLINQSPDEKQDDFLTTFTNSFFGAISPAAAVNTKTEQQTGSDIKTFADLARVEPSDIAAENLNKKLEDYGFGGAFWGQTLGGSLGTGASIFVGGKGMNLLTGALKAGRFTAPLADFLTTTKGGKAILSGGAYELGGKILPASSGEANFGTGLIGEIATYLPSPVKGLAPALTKLFGDSAEKAAKYIGNAFKRGIAETGQETAQSLYQIYADTPTGQSVFDNIKQQFGEPSDILKFAISTFIMGAAMGGGADLGLHQSNVDAVNQLSPDERTVYDSFTGEQRAKANSDIIGIAKEQAPKVPTENLQKQADNTQEALTKLQSELESPDQSYSIEVDGIKYEGTSKEDLQSDIQYLTDLNGIVNEELYNRNTGQTETPPIAEADQTDVEQPKPEAGVGVGETKVKEADNFVSNLKDDEDVTITVATLDEVPAKFKDRAIESKERTADVQKSFLGIPYGKKETRTVKEKSYTYTATGKEIKDEYNSAKPLIKETPEKVKQEQPLVKQSDTANLPQDVQDKIAKLRADEQTALRNALPNYKNYLTDGKVDKAKITDDADLAKFNKIYDKYNAPITALVKGGKKQESVIKDEVIRDGDDLILKHGSPHNFEKFQLEKIGTGEGAQAFGYGLYFTDGSKIAKGYAKKLSEDKTGIVYEVRIKNGAKKNWAEWREPLDETQEQDLYNSLTKEEKDDYNNHLKKAFYPDSELYDTNYERDYTGAFDDLKLSEDGFADYGDSGKPSAAGSIYQDLKDAFGQQKATEIFKRAGIDGIKYRSKKGYGENYNYVVFDPNSIEITKKSNEVKNLPQEVEVKETVSEKQVSETTKQIYTDTNEVGATQYYTVNDNGNVESSIEVSPVGSDIVIDNAKVSPTEKRKGLASSLVDKIIQDYKGKTNTYIDENGNEITEPYQIKLGTVVSNEGTGFAKSIQKKIDDFNAEQQQITKAPKGQVKAEPSVKAAAKKEAAPTEKVEAEPTADIDNVANKAGIAPKNLRDLYNINRTLFGLNKVKSLAAAVAMDRMVGVMAKRAGLAKAEMYARLRFKKASEQDLKDKNVLWQGASALSNFDKWKGSNELLGGAAIQDAKTGQPIVVRVYHGTTNDFYEFDASIKGNVEGHLGKVNYFTSDYQDAANNYQAEGADLINRIGSRKDSIEQELENTYDDFFSDKNRIAEDYGYTGNQLTALGSFSALAADIAEKELKGGTERVLDVFVKLNNPVVLGNGSTWFETLNVSESDLDQAAQEIADENDISIDEAKEDYEYDIRSRAIENTGYGNLAEEALSDALNANGYDGSMAAELLGDGFYDTEIDLNKLEKDLRKAELYENEQGEIASSQVIADFFKNLGFDGIILTDVSNRFKGMGIGGSTSHVHVFDNFSNQIKLADGSNTSFGETRDIRFQKNKGKAQGAVMVTMDGNAVIYALTDPNVSTPLHEVAHVFEHYLTDSERATVNNWAKTGAWTTETSEKFARGFEKYLSEGVAPTEGLKKVFEKFKTWLTDIYNGIKGSNIDIELNDDMRSIYAQMLGKDAVPPQKAKAAPKKAKKAVIQSDVIDNLVKGAKRDARQKAINSIADTKVKEVATVISDTNGRFKKVMDILNGDTDALTELENSIGFKKIC
jgi:predicted GNAT family acetyltransferase